MKLLVFGEILWDIIGEEAKIGGAPFNFAAHAARLGAEASVISAVGEDDLGSEALRLAKSFGVNCDGVAVLPGVPTGRCLVTLKDGTPSYDLVRGVAYDCIPMPTLPLKADAFYFGSLAMRDGRSERTLRTLLAEGEYGEVFFDVNIRQNYYTAEKIAYGLSHCTVFKVSREEIGTLSLLGIEGDEIECCRKLRTMFGNLRTIIVTLDKDGALAYDCRSDKAVYAPVQVCPVVSTVGAGDSFSACYLVNTLAGFSAPECLRRASLLAGYVVTQLGAIPDYPEELRANIIAKK